MLLSLSSASPTSADEDYKPPNAIDLEALLSESKAVRSFEPKFDSRESTPFMMDIPLGVDHWRSNALASKLTLERSFGKSAVNEIRQSIYYAYYWKTEALNYAEHWNLLNKKPLNQLAFSHSATTDSIREMISDRQYWETEAMHYKRHIGLKHWAYETMREPKVSTKSSGRPSGIRKSRTSQRYIPRAFLEDAPVSSRLRSRKNNQQAEKYLNKGDVDMATSKCQKFS